jgi:hypothetical protein
MLSNSEILTVDLINAAPLRAQLFEPEINRQNGFHENEMYFVNSVET